MPADRRPNVPGRHLTIPPWAMLGLLLYAAVAVSLAATLQGHGARVTACFVFSATLIGVALVRLESAHAFDPWAPLGFPFAYTVFTLTAGTVVAATVGFGGVFLAQDLVTTELLLAQGLFATAFLVGILVVPRGRAAPGVPATDLPRPPRSPFLVQLGFLAIAAPAAYRVYQLRGQGLASWNLTRGVDFSIASQLEIVAGLLPLVGVTLLLIGDRSRHRTVIPAPALALLGVWAIASLAIGSRGELLAPVIMLAWAFHHRVRSFTRTGLVVVLAAGFAVLALVGVWRSQSLVEGVGLAELVRPTASGVNTTAETMRFVPDRSGHLHGETYLAALRASIPLPPAPTGEAGQTASLRLPSLIGYQADSGLGYSPVGEAYWNFGWVGLAVAPLIFGVLLAWTHRRSDPFGGTPIAYLYPVVISRLPIDLRSDSLQQFKGVLLVMVAVTAVWLCQQALRGGHAPSTARHRERVG